MDTETTTLTIEGMHCAACVRRVTAALNTVPGIKVEDVQVGSARIVCDPALPASTINAAIEKVGFKVT